MPNFTTARNYIGAKNGVNIEFRDVSRFRESPYSLLHQNEYKISQPENPRLPAHIAMYRAALALLHGVNGVRWSIDDYVTRPGRRAAVKALLYSVTGALFAYGTLVIVSYG